MPEVKICGLTRAEDAQLAARHGAAWVGVVFAESPRRVDAREAGRIFASLPSGDVRRVGVFSRMTVPEVLSIAATVPLDVVQLHDAYTAGEIEAIGEAFAGEVWVVLRVGAEGIPAGKEWLFGVADGVVLDAMSSRGLGGTGESFPWRAVATDVERLRGTRRLVVAGGLRADNVGLAIEALHPDVVDVSSGVESATGIKDEARLLAFVDAARRYAHHQDEE